jgi:hypothetical protein
MLSPPVSLYMVVVGAVVKVEMWMSPTKQLKVIEQLGYTAVLGAVEYAVLFDKTITAAAVVEHTVGPINAFGFLKSALKCCAINITLSIRIKGHIAPFCYVDAIPVDNPEESPAKPL